MVLSGVQCFKPNFPKKTCWEEAKQGPQESQYTPCKIHKRTLSKVDWYNSNNVQYYQDAVIVDVDHDMNL